MDLTTNSNDKKDDDDEFKYINASMKLIKELYTNQEMQVNNVLYDIEKYINELPKSTPIESIDPIFKFLLNSDNTINNDEKNIVMSTSKTVLNTLKNDWTLPSWIRTFKSWLLKYNDADYLKFKKLGINQYKKNIKGFIYKSFLENDPNFRYLISVSGADEGTLSSVENAFIELKKGTDNDFESEDFLDHDIIYNQKNIKNAEEIAKGKKEAETKGTASSGGKKSKSRKKKQYKKSHNPKNKKSHKNQHKNKKRK
jgi:hypothetical protein